MLLYLLAVVSARAFEKVAHRQLPVASSQYPETTFGHRTGYWQLATGNRQLVPDTNRTRTKVSRDYLQEAV